MNGMDLVGYVKIVDKSYMIVYFLFQSVLSLVLFMIYLFMGNYGDGYIGMAPLSMMLGLGIQILISTLLYYLVRNFVKLQKKYFFIIMHMIIFELSFLFFSYSSPISSIFEEGFKGFISRAESFSSLFSGLCILIIYFLQNRNSNKKI